MGGGFWVEGSKFKPCPPKLERRRSSKFKVQGSKFKVGESFSEAIVAVVFRVAVLEASRSDDFGSS